MIQSTPLGLNSHKNITLLPPPMRFRAKKGNFFFRAQKSLISPPPMGGTPNENPGTTYA